MDLFSNEIIDSNEWILGREYQEFYQRQGSVFGAQSESNVVALSQDNLRDETVFELSTSDNKYLDSEDMYFQCYFQGVSTDLNDAEIRSHLDIGGIASLINEVEVELGNLKLERISEYGKLNSAISLMTDSPHYVDYNLMKQADSMGDYFFNKFEEERRSLDLNELDVRYIKEGDSTVFTPLSITAGETQYDQVGGAFYAVRELRLSDPAGGNNGDAVGNVDAGDLLLLWNDTTKTVLYARVETTPTDNNYIQITEGSSISAFRQVDHNVVPAIDEQFDAIYVIDNDDLAYEAERSARARAMNQGDKAVKLTFRLRLESLNIMKRIPLPLMRHKLRITIRWKDPRIGMVLRDSSNVAVDNKFGYKIEDPRIIAPMLEVSYRDMERHKLLLKQGVGYKYKTYDHYQADVARDSTNTVLDFKNKAISVRYILFVLTDSLLANTTTRDSQGHASNSTFYKNFLQRVRVRVGQDQYPRYGDIVVDDLFSSEAMEMTKMSLTGKKEFDENLRIFSYDWQNQDSEKFVCAVPIAITDEHLEGRDVSNDLIELRLSFAGTPNNLINDATLHMWVCFDKILLIKDDEIKIVE